MKKKCNVCTRAILIILIVLYCNAPASARSDCITEAVFSCCKCIADGANTAVNSALELLTSESAEIVEKPYSDYPEGYDTYDPIAMGEVDPWEAYRAQQAEDMDRAMAEEAQRAWQEYNEPQPDIYDGIIKP